MVATSHSRFSLVNCVASLLVFPAFVVGLTSCSSQAPLPEPHTLDTSVPKYKNPFEPTTYAHFVAQPDYKKSYKVYRDEALIQRQPKKSQSIYVCLDDQRGQYVVDGLVAMDFPLSSGVKAFPTKIGDYKVIQKKEAHASNLYGKMYDAEGKCIDTDAEITDPVPEGGKFVGSPMPYWQRLTYAGLGLHVGKVKRKPVSHGCIRLTRDVAKTLYEQTTMGTRVKIRDEFLPVSEKQKRPSRKK